MKVIDGQINLFNEDHKPAISKKDKSKAKEEIKIGMFVKCIDNSAWFGGKFKGIKKGNNYRVKNIITSSDTDCLIIVTDEGYEIALSKDRFAW